MPEQPVDSTTGIHNSALAEHAADGSRAGDLAVASYRQVSLNQLETINERVTLCANQIEPAL